MIKYFPFYVLIFISTNAHAQLCTGSLGDPVVNINFGNGTTGGTNYVPSGSYAYTASTCPNDGFYTITNSSIGCFSSTWHSVLADHTGGGAFMLVNASFQPADFFLTTVKDLCPQTTYEFSAWVMNVLNGSGGIEPNITFSIETTSGVILNQFNTSGIPVTAAPEWKQYGFYFTTTTGATDVVLRMTNNAPGGIGNDLALDDITFRPCGPTVNSTITGNNNSIDVCEYDQQPLSFTASISPGYITPAYFWQVSNDSGKNWIDISGANTLTYQRSPTQEGSYWYRMSVSETGNGSFKNCRISSNILELNIHPRPVVNAGSDKFVVIGEKAILDASVSGNNNRFLWSPPDYLNDNTILNPEITPLSDKEYTLDVISEFGCVNDDLVKVKVVTDIFVPTAFTPNNDGKNDYWRIPFLDPQFDAEVKVFNRYGQVVYSIASSYVNWDGKFNDVLQPSGTYVYLIRFKKNTKLLKGILTLIR